MKRQNQSGISAGELRHLVTIVRTPAPDEVAQDELGHPIASTPIRLQRRAKIEPLKGREYWQAQQVQSDITHAITFRGPLAISSVDKIEFRGRTFEVASKTNVAELGAKVVVMAIERTST